MTRRTFSFRGPLWLVGWCSCVATAVLALSGCEVKMSPSGVVSPAPLTAVPANSSEAPHKNEAVAQKSDDANSTAAKPFASAAAPATAPATDKPAADTKRPRPEETVAITFDDLNLQMQADMVFRDWMLTDRVKELDGRRVRISGAMLAGLKQVGVKEFVLLKNAECKFGAGGQADHLLNVTLQAGLEAAFTKNSVQLEGTLKINPFNGPDGNTWYLYDLAADSFKKLRK